MYDVQMSDAHTICYFMNLTIKEVAGDIDVSA